MRDRLRWWVVRGLLAAAGGWLLQAGCLRDVQREIDLLRSPEGSLDQVYDSWLVNTFGPKVLQFW
ncbi:MAG: hypothetical protein HY718_13225 [Planctomycetes bacterium]|nr:hypothetical protein [Planctomycetota bacterium]